MENIDIKAFTELASQFGPFFFALLFTLMITRTARSWYVACSVPPRAEGEKEEFRRYFLYSYRFSIVLVIISLAWYFYYHWGKHYVYEGVLTGLSQTQTITPAWRSVYVKEYRRLEHPGEIREIYFAIVSDTPIQNGRKITFQYWDNSSVSNRQPLGVVGRPPEPIPIPVTITKTNEYPSQFHFKLVNGRPTIEQLEGKP